MDASQSKLPDDLPVVPLDHPLGRRLLIAGGGGKSTLAKALSVRTGLPYIELDALHWLPDWVERDAESFKAKVMDAIAAAPDGWIVDGNYYSKLGDLVLAQADIVIWVDMPWRVMFWRTFKRSFQRAWDKRKICGENTESWRRTLSADSLWWYHIRTRRRYNSRGERIGAILPPGAPLVRLSSPAELNRFYAVHGLVRE
jgi:adenylate kinase family enzyme